MSKKKKKDNIDPLDIYQDMLGIIATGGSGFAGLTTLITNSPTMKDPRDEDVFDLGHGISIVKDETIKNNDSRYSHLYKDGKKISKTIFRLGGMGYGFNGKPYTHLIVYPKYPKDTWGNHCIIDSDGKIVLTQEKSFDYLYYSKGVIASMGSVYYNLLTGKPIVKGNSSSMSSKHFLFIDNSYNDDYTRGVYKIDFATGEFEIFE